MKLWMLFVLIAALSWGAYVPMIHHGQMGFGEPKGPFRAFLFVGVAYFLLAILVPGGMLLTKAEPPVFPGGAVALSTVAGLLGATGALCVIFALKSGGSPIYVAPLIFAGAPVVNVLVSMVWDRPKQGLHPMFVVGILLAAVGAGLVLRYKPGPGQKPAAPAAVHARSMMGADANAVGHAEGAPGSSQGRG